MTAPDAVPAAMQITLNGEPREVPEGISIAELIAQMPLAGRRVAVEWRGEILPRSQYAQARVAAGDVIEIVQAIGGG